MKTTPPFRADHVGSLLRPAEVRVARAERAEGRITAQQLAAIEDRAIERVVAHQEAIGLRSITDGEIRRESWVGDFLSGLDGTTTVLVDDPMSAQGKQRTEAAKPKKTVIVTGEIGFSNHPMLGHFRFVRENTKATPKMTIPAPAMMVSAARNWRQIVSRQAYADINDFYGDLGLAYRKAVKAFYDVGCRYLQFDDVNMAYLCDPNVRAQLKSRGDDPDTLLRTWVDVVNTAISNRPSDMVIATHICRGNFRSSWFASGGYEPIADVLFNQFDYDGYFLEYDSERAGGFEPLRFVPKGKKFVVLGLLTSKTGDLEDKGLIKSRIEAATRYVDLGQLCLSPQCGFSSTEHGNVLAEERQWDKLAEVVEIADEVWSDD
jgi:5-methyltetrahydropteroyltriglutamate--homocysteine methyltransferase